MRRLLVVTAALCAAIGCAGGNAVAASTQSSYGDPCGDAGGAPDICAVDISAIDTGRLTVSISLQNRPISLVGADNVLVYLDTDRNPNTGCAALPYNSLGFEYALAATN